MPRPGPVERIRAQLAERAGPEVAALLPVHYQRIGRVVLVRWPEALRPEFPWLAQAIATGVRSEAVGRLAGPVEGERRRPRVEVLLGDSLETRILEDGIRYRFDAGEILYSRGNNVERARIARLVRSGERVVDLFAGIGYFALPAARHGGAREVIAVEENPRSFGFLTANIAANHLEDQVRPILGDNRKVDLPLGLADRVFLGYLPDSLPWVGRAVGLLHPGRGWIHVHTLAGARDPEGSSVDRVRQAVVSAGASWVQARERTVKSYGPGRVHQVVDAEVDRPRTSAG
ncbi:MAG TPA: class I SAM-dependent methyltransferase family protein [Thermoplasmata archaeon]|nr:class I SAM-dependent methyltransferase family protein [Thermoplasmata archaeon]